MCFSKLGGVNYSCHLSFFSLRDNVLLMTTHLSQFSLAVNKGTKSRLNHTALKNVKKATDFSHFFRIAIIYAIYAIIAFIVFLDFENVGLHILLSTIR